MDFMKDLLRKMLNGMCTQSNSFDVASNSYAISDQAAMLAHTDDALEAELLHLFSYWGNDVQGIAAHYGLEIRKGDNGKLFVAEDVPPAPSISHYWSGKERVWVGDGESDPAYFKTEESTVNFEIPMSEETMAALEEWRDARQ